VCMLHIASSFLYSCIFIISISSLLPSESTSYPNSIPLRDLHYFEILQGFLFARHKKCLLKTEKTRERKGRSPATKLQNMILNALKYLRPSQGFTTMWFLVLP
jgi:hypothetical protein